MLLVVCDSSPLIYLARLDRFDLLRQLHEAVLVPPAVWDEVAVQGADLPEGKETKRACAEGWLTVSKPQSHLTISAADAEDLDPGEEEAIQLAIEKNCLLAIDEKHGRYVAAKLGLKVIGTVGLLIRGRREGIISSLRAEPDRLRSETTFRMSESLYRDALLAVAEQIP